MNYEEKHRYMAFSSVYRIKSFGRSGQQPSPKTVVPQQELGYGINIVTYDCNALVSYYILLAVMLVKEVWLDISYSLFYLQVRMRYGRGFPSLTTVNNLLSLIMSASKGCSYY